MTIGVDIAAALPELRRQAESLMVDTCTITRPSTDAPVFDEALGQYTYPAPVMVYAGPCQFQAGIVAAQNPDAAEERVTLQEAVVKLPVAGSDGVRVDDTVTCDTAAHDADLPGHKFRVDALHHKTYATARRLACAEITGG